MSWEDVRKTVSDLNFGDVVQIDWLDASEATGTLQSNQENVDTLVRSLGYFLGLKGKRTKHIVIAKEIILDPQAYHYNAIPLKMVREIRILHKSLLEPKVKRVLKKLVRNTLCKIGGKAGWKYAEAQTHHRKRSD